MRFKTLTGFLILFLLGLLVSACCGHSDFDELARWMTGSFSSQKQATADSTYFDIRLEMHRIWPDHKDGVWLYVEQAVASHVDRPYRQRVYQLKQESDGVFSSAVFTFPDPLRFAGKWREPAPLAALTPDSLILRNGCAVFLKRTSAGHFSGSTFGSECSSTLGDAEFATSEVTVTADQITSWDRGYNSSGEQVWGATDGAYIFDRISSN